MTTTTPEREALAAAFDRLHRDGFQRQEDWFVKNAGEEFMEQIHVDTIALIAASPAAGGVQALTDEQIIKRCSDAGIQWLVPDADPDGFPGGFDMCSMADMRKLLAAAPPAAPAPASDEREAPSVPDTVLTYIHAYGDARADDDGTSVVRLAEAILAMRRWAASLAARAPQAAAEGQAQVEALLKLSLAVENARIEWYDDTSDETLLRLKHAREALRSALVAALTPQAAPAPQPTVQAEKGGAE